LPQYVSSATQSVVITIAQLNGSTYTGSPASFAVNLTTSSPNCSGSPLACTLSVSSPVGSVTFSVATYDAQQPSTSPTPAGNLLSAASLTLNVTTGGSNAASLVLGGVPASISATPSGAVTTPNGPNMLIGGVLNLAMYGASAQLLALNALDASGETIIGQGAPVLSLSTTSSAVSISSVSPNMFAIQPATSGTPPTLTPNGLTLTATATPAQNSGASPLSVTIPLALVHSVVAVSTGTYVDVFLDGNTTYSYRISTGLSGPRGVAIDGSQTIYVANHGNGSVTVYPAGQASPTLTITNGLTYPEGIAIDVSDNVWVAESSNGNVIEYLAGTTTPNVQVSTGFSTLRGVVVDYAGDIFITNQTSGMFGLIQFGALVVTTGTSLSAPIGIAMDPNGNPWVADSAGFIYGFTPPYSSGMSYTYTLMNGDYPSPVGLAIDSGSGFWIADSGTGYVVNCLSPEGQGGCRNVISDPGALWVAVFPEAQP